MKDGKDPDTEKQEKDGSIANILWAGVSIAIPILLIYLYNFSDLNYSIAGTQLKKITNEEENIDVFLSDAESKKISLRKD